MLDDRPTLTARGEAKRTIRDGRRGCNHPAAALFDEEAATELVDLNEATLENDALSERTGRTA